MTQACILTDSTVQFSRSNFPGSDLVRILSWRARMGEHILTDGKDLKPAILPGSLRCENSIQLIAPTVDDFHQAVQSLERTYKDIFIILMSSRLNQAAAAAKAAADTLSNIPGIHIIDSQTTGVGLGLLVQSAAAAAVQNQEASQIARMVRGLTSQIYSIFCIQGLSYLHNSGCLDPAQAVVGEMLGMLPCFILENGQLTPIDKIRSSRHLLDILSEFIHEFDQLNHIAYLHGLPPNGHTARIFKDRSNLSFPSASYSEHNIGGALAAMIGPRSLGVAVLENQPIIS